MSKIKIHMKVNNKFSEQLRNEQLKTLKLELRSNEGVAADIVIARTQSELIEKLMKLHERSDVELELHL